MIQNYTDLQIIAQALGMWRNHIETGTVTMSAQDAKNCGNEDTIKPLEIGQQRFLTRLASLQSKALTQDGGRTELAILRDVVEEVCHDQLNQGLTLQRLLETKNPSLAQEYKRLTD